MTQSNLPFNKKKQGDTHLAVFIATEELVREPRTGPHRRVSFVAARFGIFGHKSAEFARV